MRIIFFGTSGFAVPSLKALAAKGHAVVRCVTQPDRPQGRGLGLEPSPVKQAALALRLPLTQPDRLTAAHLEGVSADAGVLASYGALIRTDVLKLTPHGVLGVHPSVLPKYRGAAPVPWALLNGETETGVSIYRLVEAMDAGPVFRRRRVAVEPDETADHLLDRLAVIGAEELVLTLSDLEAGRATASPQDDAHATFAPKLTKAHGRIAWDATAERIVRQVRALTPWPGAWTGWDGGVLKIWSAAAAGNAADAEPGMIVRASADSIDVATGEGIVAIKELQAAGRRRMPSGEFLAGRRLKVGDRFDA